MVEFEQGRLFTDESTDATLGRMYWLMARQGARLLLLLDGLGLPREQVQQIYDVHDTMQYEWLELVQAGLDVDETTARPAQHPMQTILEDFIDDLSSYSGDADDEVEERPMAALQQLELEGASIEDLIHRLQELEGRWRTDES